jgi:hypothetical protein
MNLSYAPPDLDIGNITLAGDATGLFDFYETVQNEETGEDEEVTSSMSWNLPREENSITLVAQGKQTGDGKLTVTHSTSGAKAEVNAGVLKVNITLDGLTETQEESPGGFVGVKKRKPLSLEVEPTSAVGNAVLTLSNKLKLYDAVTEGNEITAREWSAANLPTSLYVEGLSASSAVRDQEAKLTWKEKSDQVKITVVGLNVSTTDTTEQTEESPGTFISINTTKNLSLSFSPNDLNIGELELSGGDGKLKFYQGTTEIQQLKWDLSSTSLPNSITIKGIEWGETTLTWKHDKSEAEDKLKITVVDFNLKIEEKSWGQDWNTPEDTGSYPDGTTNSGRKWFVLWTKDEHRYSPDSVQPESIKQFITGLSLPFSATKTSEGWVVTSPQTGFYELSPNITLTIGSQTYQIPCSKTVDVSIHEVTEIIWEGVNPGRKVYDNYFLPDELSLAKLETNKIYPVFDSPALNQGRAVVYINPAVPEGMKGTLHAKIFNQKTDNDDEITIAQHEVLVYEQKQITGHDGNSFTFPGNRQKSLIEISDTITYNANTILAVHPRVVVVDSYVRANNSDSITCPEIGAVGNFQSPRLDITINITILKIPLGGSVNLSKYVLGKVYEPTKWGGKLSVGGGASLYYTDGSDLTPEVAWKIIKGDLTALNNPYEVPENKHKWYYVHINATSPTEVNATFTQKGEADKRPWDFYYWKSKPSTDTARPNLYADNGPLQKYDIYVHSQNASHSLYAAKEWEAVNHVGTVDWAGHCLGATVASILLNQPTPITSSNLSQDEMEGLWAELGESSNIQLDSGFGGCPAGAPIEGTDSTDNYAGACHDTLEQIVKSSKTALYANLRAETAGPNKAGEVWNHAIWKYNSIYTEAPGDNHLIIKIEDDIKANSDRSIPTNNVTDREFKYVYIVEYGSNGNINITGMRDWISVSGAVGYAPQVIGRVKSCNWTTLNPHVNKTRVKELDDAN